MNANNGRLSMSSLLNNSMSSTSSAPSNSASLAKAERQIKGLQEENVKLRKELENIRLLYKQLTSENSHEKFDERRITVLKSQVIQLERQILLMSDAIGNRTATLTEVENALIQIADKWRYYIGLEIKGPEVSIPRADLTQMVHIAESARIKLYKNLENSAHDKLFQPFLCMTDFVKPQKQEVITLFDVASGNLDHLNLKQVTKLETKLALLYKEMIHLHEILEPDMEENQDVKEEQVTSSKHVASAVRDRFKTRLLKSCAMMKDCCADLLSLSLLYPCAPWPPLKKNAIKDVSAAHVIKSLPLLPKSKSGDVHSVIEALIRTFNYKNQMTQHEIKSLRDELKFHKSIYDLQLSYVQSLFSVIREGYQTFQVSCDDIIAKPFREVLESYTQFKEEASEDGFKAFILKFDNCYEKVEHAVSQICVSDGEEFSEFGETFLRDLDKKINRFQNIRDKTSRERQELKSQQEKLERELRQFLDEQEVKYQEYLKPEPETSTVLPPQDEVVFFMKTEDVSETENQNNLIQVESSMANLSLDSDRNSNPQSDRKPKSRKKTWLNKEWNPCTTVDSVSDSGAGSTLPDETITPDTSLPPQGKGPKRTKKMVPSAFVPNRTLNLRRSGSLSSIDKSVLPNGKLKPLDYEKEKSDVTSAESRKAPGVAVDKGHSKRTRSTSSKRTPFY
uniref:Uncharacterized protein LOC111128586 n=1 Tax=Crassostrea virginica TaxID=6565 RepID=A0A8B8DP65_CRAVI|nr:uncharacterized protein LOC111128586 [Crassostrea virginica]XP_022329997.1 uncharacterized protein LOC111128586 [Crassostrea virginica]XP_022329998.1 uncharacterized protein LOC111128586 [Crassostrea virginica]